MESPKFKIYYRNTRNHSSGSLYYSDKNCTKPSKFDGTGIVYSYTDIGMSKSWYVDNYLHRLDGPAVEWHNTEGDCYWWYEGYRIDCSSQVAFEKLLKFKAFW